MLFAIKLYSKINTNINNNYKLNIYMFGDPFQIAPIKQTP